MMPIVYDSELTAFDLEECGIAGSGLLTELTLSDYDWMQYVFRIRMPTKLQGLLIAEMTYSGSLRSTMKVTQITDGNTFVRSYEFSSELFTAFLRNYMTEHLKQWEKPGSCFDGFELGIRSYNSVLTDVDS
jgi:hypothetical protein